MPPLAETEAACATTSGLTSLLSPSEEEVARVLQICNACRYCAVFPAMTRRLEFSAADTHYLANLCHNCGACLCACQYAPPHAFAVNVPKAMAKVRMTTYQSLSILGDRSVARYRCPILRRPFGGETSR
ncbi:MULTISPECIES: hypothetical protein [unclassified Bradyrhizobium]|uniref:hypothetical protein n=1 Tax=unclassified Bradyrhizobium TaxID=2631580 RepID=UPI0028E826A5|nr:MULTISPECIES: hypothetical protein [unclassified Bradyrhizobium]